MMRIIHLIGSLNIGGAETQLVRLAEGQRRRGHEVLVLVFEKSETVLSSKLEKANIQVVSIGFVRGEFVRGFKKIMDILDYEVTENTIIQSWMDLSNILISIVWILGRIQKKRKFEVIWSIRNSKPLSFRRRYYLALPICFLLVFFSYFVPRRIIFNSYKGQSEFHKIGYRKSKTAVIHNCFDATFGRNTANLDRKHKRFSIGFVGRNHPDKNFEGFQQLVSRLNSEVSGLFDAVVAGRGYSDLSAEPGYLQLPIRFLGEVSDISNLFNQIDLLVITSKTEGFPNVLCEALLSGVNCCGYDVGDIARIMGKEFVVPFGEIEKLVSMVKKQILIGSGDRLKAREKMLGRFSVESAVAAYEAEYKNRRELN